MSGAAIRDAVRRAQPPLPGDGDDCPVVALGQRGGVYFFVAASGEIRDLKARDLTELNMVSLFDGNPAWLLSRYEKETGRGKPTGEIDVARAAAALMRRCAEAGLWRPETPRRLAGVWRDAARGDGAGGVIAHCGDVVYLYAPGKKRQMMKAGMRRGEALYLATPAMPPPSRDAASAGDARTLLAAIDGNWRFAGTHLSRLVFGAIALGMLGAAPRWRVHLLLTGTPGQAGKTTLLRLMAAALGPQGASFNDPTEAGIRERFSDEARMLFFDEAGKQGGEDHGTRVEFIIGMLRRMAGEEGAVSLRGSGAGAREYNMNGSVVMAAANAPVLDAQDRSRILEVVMLPADPATSGRAAAAAAAAASLSDGLRARALEGFPRFEANLKVYHAALVAAGCDARGADQVGTLFAAAEMMLSDDVVAHASDDMLAFGGEIERWRVENEELSNALRCFGTLMSTQIDHWKSGAKSTIGRLVQLARGPSGSSERAALRTYGVRLEDRADGPQLWIANQHRALDRVFAGTDWRGGGWHSALRQLRGAVAGEKPAWFDGHRARFMIVPGDYLPPEDENAWRGPV